MQQRIQLYYQGLGPRPRGLPPEEPRHNSTWECPEMLDTTGLIVDAVYMTIPASVWTYLSLHPNPRTHHGKYKPIRRYTGEHSRKHRLAEICRQYWLPYQGYWNTNRCPGEPYHRYLTMALVGQLVRYLLYEFRCRLRPLFGPPFPRFRTPEEDYKVWEMQAVRGVQEMLHMEAEMLRA